MNQLKQLEQKYKELGAEIEALKNKPSKKRWRSNHKQSYWVFNSRGIIHNSLEIFCETDNQRYAIGNYYETEELATQARDKQLATIRVLDRLRELEGDWVADWNDNTQNKFRAIWNYYYKAFDMGFCKQVTAAPIEWYSSEEAWEQVIKEMKHAVKLMFGV